MTPADETYQIKDPDQLRAISDPLRRTLLGAFSREARTTKQVADTLGIKTKKLYHHVALLEGVGLLRLVETRPKRGTTERYLEAVAKRFTVHPEALGEEGDGAAALFRDAFDGAMAEIEKAGEILDGEVWSVLLQGRLRLGEESRLEFEKRLHDLVREFSSASKGDRYGIVLAAYPVTESE